MDIEKTENSPVLRQVTDKLTPIIEALKTLDYGQSIKLPIGTDEFFLEQVAKEFSKGQKAYVVLKLEVYNSFELAMLPCGQTRSLYYSVAAKAEKILSDKGLEEKTILNVIKEYLNSNYDKVKAYGTVTPEMLFSRIIPYGYIQRRCVTLAVFRNSKLGATKELLANIDSMLKNGVIEEVSENHMFDNYKTRSRAFRLKE